MTTTGNHPQPAGAQAKPNGAPAAVNGKPTAKPQDEKALAMQDFRSVLQRMRPQIQKALPSHLDVERMIRIVCTSVQQNPDLLNCTRESILARIMQCAQLGLEPDGLLGHAWLVPFNERRNNRVVCQLFIGYKGLVKLARQSGEVSGFSVRLVQAKDEFDFEYGLDERLVHKPYQLTDVADDPGEPVYAYAVIRFKGGSHQFEVMSAKEIERIRLNAPSKDSDAWVKWWDEMAKKTVLRRALKLSPLSVEDKMARAIALDERAEAGLPQDVDGSEDGIIDVVPTIVSPGGIVVSTLRQRKDIARLSEEARVSEADVAGRFSKQSVDELSHDEADQAIKQLKEMIAKEGAAA